MIYSTDFIDNLENFLSRLTRFPFRIHIPKPFSCDFCMAFWTTLIYLLSTQIPFLYIPLIAISCAFLVNPINLLVNLIITILETSISSIEKFILKQ